MSGANSTYVRSIPATANKDSQKIFVVVANLATTTVSGAY
jgi:hypothetical protein